MDAFVPRHRSVVYQGSGPAVVVAGGGWWVVGGGWSRVGSFSWVVGRGGGRGRGRSGGGGRSSLRASLPPPNLYPSRVTHGRSLSAGVGVLRAACVTWWCGWCGMVLSSPWLRCG